MTPKERERLRTLAEAAEAGPWGYAEDHPVVYLKGQIGAPIVCRMCPDDLDPGTDDIANGRYIAAAHPQAVLSLLTALTERDAELAAMTRERDGALCTVVQVTLERRERDAEVARLREERDDSIRRQNARLEEAERSLYLQIQEEEARHEQTTERVQQLEAALGEARPFVDVTSRLSLDPFVRLKAAQCRSGIDAILTPPPAQEETR